MRFSVFLALAIATFVASISFTNAESVAHPESVRNLRTQTIPQGLVGKADDVAEKFKAKDIVAKFLESTRTNSLLKRAAALEANGLKGDAAFLRANAAGISKLKPAQKQELGRMVAEIAKKDPEKLAQAVVQGAKNDPSRLAQAMGRVAKEEPEKLAQMANEVAKKNPKKWSTFQMVLVGLVAGGATYLGTKWLSSSST
ncbi:putative secreted RxLR effector protein [Phytophthora cinnamomi]|uniref:putative secreted RxLR effector protein n=1 Tax=Phytophthora cinnamomi TaxID=4785 RepID=UPI002B2F5ADF|nr:putative secreted RxLR effector protein [Phytophthora cinnamomi]QVE55574.1 RxLR effector protein 71 [Phytophthora cinnamomi]